MRSGSYRLEELEDEPALTDARYTDERYELRLALLRDTGPRASQERELALASDELRVAESLDTDAGTSPRACHTVIGCDLPFASIAARLLVLDGALGRTHTSSRRREALRGCAAA